jgi:hypothetical protein
MKRSVPWLRLSEWVATTWELQASFTPSESANHGHCSGLAVFGWFGSVAIFALVVTQLRKRGIFPGEKKAEASHE